MADAGHPRQPRASTDVALEAAFIIGRLVEALRPFARRAGDWDRAVNERYGGWRPRDSHRIDVRLGDCRAARDAICAAMEPGGDDDEE